MHSNIHPQISTLRIHKVARNLGKGSFVNHLGKIRISSRFVPILKVWDFFLNHILTMDIVTYFVFKDHTEKMQTCPEADYLLAFVLQ